MKKADKNQDRAACPGTKFNKKLSASKQSGPLSTLQKILQIKSTANYSDFDDRRHNDGFRADLVLQKSL